MQLKIYFCVCVVKVCHDFYVFSYHLLYNSRFFYKKNVDINLFKINWKKNYTVKVLLLKVKSWEMCTGFSAVHKYKSTTNSTIDYSAVNELRYNCHNGS